MYLATTTLKRFRKGLLAVLLTSAAPIAHAQRLVLIDQDGSGPGGSNQMAMMVLLQSPRVRVLGITMVSGNAWEPEEVAHTLRMLELIHRTDVPVVPGAIFPLVRTEAATMHDTPGIGSFPWYGAYGDLAKHTSAQPYHGPYVVPPLEEGNPTIRPLDEDAAHFLIRQVHAHPHAVTIYAAGPLTNIALAITIDPAFAELTQGIVIMGGSLNPETDDPEFATHPRHEFNFWFDPEATHITFQAHWPRIDLTDVDISIKTMFTPEMEHEIAQSKNPAAQYIARYTHEHYYLWDELAAAAWLNPKIITKEQILYVDCDTSHGPNYGDTLTWTATNKPTLPGNQGDMQPVHVQQDLDVPLFDRTFVDLMKAPPVAEPSTH